MPALVQIHLQIKNPNKSDELKILDRLTFT